MKKYILLLFGLLFASSAFGQLYRLNAYPDKLTVPKDGSQAFSVSVDCMDTVLDLRYVSYSATHASQIESFSGRSNGFNVKFRPNSGNTISGNITVTYSTSVGNLSVSVPYTQTGEPSYAIRANPTAFEFKRGGGATTVSILYTERSGGPAPFRLRGLRTGVPLYIREGGIFC